MPQGNAMPADSLPRTMGLDGPRASVSLASGMKVAFLFIAEAYQVYHAAAIAFALRDRPDVTVDFFHNDLETPRHLARIARAHGVEDPSSRRLARGPAGALIQATRILGLAKPQVLRWNEDLLAGYDAVVSTEEVIGDLLPGQPAGQRPWRILITHGAGDRAVPAYADRPKCDLILLKGTGEVDLHLRKRLARPGHVAAGGYPKLVTSGLLARHAAPPFDNGAPTVLYSAHKVPQLESWSRFAEPMLAAFAHEPSMNLIVAPHVKLFRRRSERVRRRWRNRSTHNVLVDPGSDRLFDNSYTEFADIYVGDVSSQVYEFVARPRPCVFLNARRRQWRGDPHFRFWEMGEVIDDPRDLMPAIRRAPELHPRYRERQIELARDALGDTGLGSIDRGAALIHEFIVNGRVTA